MDALGDTKGPDLSPVPEDPGKVLPELAVIGRSISELLPDRARAVYCSFGLCVSQS
jgi:hypothetical protein